MALKWKLYHLEETLNLTKGQRWPAGWCVDCKSCAGKYVGETKRLLKTTVGEHRDEVETISDGVPFTRGNRRPQKQTNPDQPTRVM